MNLFKNVNFNNLYYFYVIATEGSLAKATKILNVSQPTLSQQLKQLEEQLGQDLFSRKGRSLKINSHGKFLLSYCHKIFKVADKMITSFMYNSQMPVKFKYKIGIAPSLSKKFVAHLLRPLFQEREIGIVTEEGDIESLIEKLQSQEIDFILTENSSIYKNKKNVRYFEIKKMRYVFVCGQGFNKDLEDLPRDLHQKPYFKYSITNTLQREVDHYFFKQNILPSVIGETDDLSIMIEATIQNSCFSIVPDIAVDEEIRSGELKLMGYFEPQESVISAFYHEKYDNSHVQGLLKKMHQFL